MSQATSDKVATVEVYALSAGQFTLPEEQFVTPTPPGARKTVPSLCFLIQHFCSTTGKTTRIVFDLGLRRDITRYSEPIQRHITTRQPLTPDPDVVKSLGAGGLTPDDIDFVIYSHVHWDHVGEPRDFLRSLFVVGHGSLDLLSGKPQRLRGGHSFFEADLLDLTRTIELPDPNTSNVDAVKDDKANVNSLSHTVNLSGPWKPAEDFNSALDFFLDGSLLIVDAPGHLPGHINLCARTKTDDGSIRRVYLAGDACHDRRILRKEKFISQWQDDHGRTCCIHTDLARAHETLEQIRRLEGKGVEVIIAHDVEWENDPKNRLRFFGSTL